MLTLDTITRRYGDYTVIDGLSHTLPERGVLLLTGASGCGKTTLLRLLAGLDRPNGGTLLGMPQRVAMVFQEPRLISWLNCKDNINIVLSKEKQSSSLAEEWLEKLELSAHKNELPTALSGGERRRLCLARALATGAELLLLDEPFAGLDQALKARIAPYIIEAGKRGLVVVTSHQSEDAALLSATTLSCIGTPISALKTI